MAKATQEVNVNVLNIENGEKTGIVHIDARFTGNEKIYSYYRKYFPDNNGNYFVIISGCKITFSHEFKLLNIAREYDVKGVKKTSTENIGKKNSKKEESKKEENQNLEDEEKAELAMLIKNLGSNSNY